MFQLNRKYISPLNQKQFVQFKYKGGTDSLTYEYLWGPFAQFLLNYVPLWMAPNLITLFSLIIVVVSHVIFMYWGSNDNGIPAWKLILMAVSILVYQNLDNIDGKQARRTKTGSPLGMLFDHGIDSLASFMISLQVLEILQIRKYNIIIPALFVFIMLTFFSALWNQYSTGVFKLGRINPVDQGLPSYALFALAAIFIPFQKLNQFHIIASMNQEILMGLGILLIILLISMNKNVLKNAVRPVDDVIQTLCLPVIVGIALLYTAMMQNDVYYEKIGLSVAYSLLFFWSRNMIEIQLYYISGQRFNCFNIGTNVFLFTHMGYLSYGKFLQQKGISVQLYFWCVTLINFLVFSQFVISVLKQGSKILDINIFTIRKKSKDN